MRLTILTLLYLHLDITIEVVPYITKYYKVQDNLTYQKLYVNLENIAPSFDKKLFSNIIIINCIETIQ